MSANSDDITQVTSHTLALNHRVEWTDLLERLPRPRPLFFVLDVVHKDVPVMENLPNLLRRHPAKIFRAYAKYAGRETIPWRELRITGVGVEMKRFCFSLSLPVDDGACDGVGNLLPQIIEYVRLRFPLKGAGQLFFSLLGE